MENIAMNEEWVNFLQELSADPEAALGAFGLVGIAGALIGAVTALLFGLAVLFMVVQAVAQWRIFTKAGEAGWKALIPWYNLYTQYKLTWDARMAYVVIGLSVVSSILSAFSENIFCSILSLAASIACIVLAVKGNYKLARSFGHGKGFTVGLVLLTPVFEMILGFGKSQFVGKAAELPQSRQ
ncbi:MAG: DUF5684 domain-containing protein [Faecalibacterium sp.]